jgi:hypothetical protein
MQSSRQAGKEAGRHPVDWLRVGIKISVSIFSEVFLGGYKIFGRVCTPNIKMLAFRQCLCTEHEKFLCFWECLQTEYKHFHFRSVSAPNIKVFFSGESVQ